MNSKKIADIGQRTADSRKKLNTIRYTLYAKPRACGSALLLVLLAVIILLAVGTGLLNLGLQGRMFAVRMGSEIAARTAADAGLTKALFAMNEKLEVFPWDANTLPQIMDAGLANCDATFSYAVTGDLGNNYVAESVGSSGQTTKSVNAILRLQGLFDYGILAEETITLYSGTVVDGYDPENPGATDVPVQIATDSSDEGSITLQPGASVDGDMLLGVDGYYPDVTPPILPDMGAIELQDANIVLTPAESGKYTLIELKVNGSITIEGGDVVLHITGDIWLGQGTELVIKPDTSLTIYLDGDLTAGNSSGINNETQDSTCFILYGTGEDQTFELKAKSDWFGAVYAPNAEISIKSGANIYGAFVSTDFETKAGGFIYYDAALRNVTTTDVGVRFIVERWQEE